MAHVHTYLDAYLVQRVTDRAEDCDHCKVAPDPVKLTGERTFPDTVGGYADAESFADLWAGDNEAYAVVVQDHGRGVLVVMDGEAQDDYIYDSLGEAEVIYDADHRPIDPETEWRIDR